MHKPSISRSPLRLLAALLAGLALALPAAADPPHGGSGGWDHGGPGGWDRGAGGWRGDRDFRGGGHFVHELPRGHRTIVFGGLPYYFGDGLWYRPWGSSFVVVAPPIGIVVPILPDGYVTLNLGSSVYYRYGDVYYMHRGDGYEVVNPPADQSQPATSAPRDDLYIYPQHGQSEARQRDDRFACYEWAVQQTGYDPTQAGGGSGYSQARRADYLRAMGACMEGRGYTVR